MGLGGSKRPKVPLDPDNLTMNHYEILRVLGKGAFGKVHAVQRRDTKELFAMKVMDKAQIMNEKMVEQVLHERHMMSQLHYPLVVNLQFAAQDGVDLFLVVDLMLGGDLRYHMKSGRTFDPERVRFYAAQTALAIKYLHSVGYIHRDIKPDNLLLDAEGNVHVTDFNLSIAIADTHHRGLVGTRSYMAPEVVSRQHYDEMIDWWSLGICMYEWSFGLVPFRGPVDEQREHILHADLRFPSGTDEQLKSVISGLLRRDPKKRYNFERLQRHPFFEGYDWDALEQLKAEAPWKPDTTKANCDGTYDLDEQFQVKKKRPPVVSTLFDAWDWKPGQTSVVPETKPRRDGDETSDETTTTSEELPEDDVRATKHKAGGKSSKSVSMDASAPTLDEDGVADARKRHKKSKSQLDPSAPPADNEHPTDELVNAKKKSSKRRIESSAGLQAQENADANADTVVSSPSKSRVKRQSKIDDANDSNMNASNANPSAPDAQNGDSPAAEDPSGPTRKKSRKKNATSTGGMEADENR